MSDFKKGAIAIAIILAVAVIGGFGIGLVALSVAGGNEPVPSTIAAASASAPATSTASAAPSPTPLPSASPTPAATPTPTASPTPAVQLPGMLAAIGDSYSQAYSVSPSYLRDHPQFSWVVGTNGSDHVTSLLEHFRALGASPMVADAATSGKKMVDAQRQAELVVAQAANLDPGKTVYVTFELGTNDLCDDPKTAIDVFTTQLQTAVDTLAVGLPAGSRLLMLPVPDFRHFHSITQANAVTRAAYLQTVNSRRCAPFLGTDSPMTMADSEAVLAAYDAALKASCDGLNAATGPAAKLRCTWNEDLLSDRDFVVADLSTVDYFHPSLSGQAKMATDTWKADIWSTFTPTP